MTLARKWMPSPNFSGRGGQGVRLIVCHTAEGSTSIESLGSFFANPAAEASSHVGIDSTPGVIGEYVEPGWSAWTAASANPFSIQAELCAFAAWSPAEWQAHPVMLDNCAQWIAEEAAAYGIPLTVLTPAQAQGGARGVCQHVDLGPQGGGHWDCGGGFPIGQVVEMARGGAAPPSAKRKGRNMIASTDTGRGYWTTTSDGAVGAFGDAQYKGGGFAPDVISGEVVGIAGCGHDGYWLLASDGGIFAFGSAQYYGRPDRV